MKQVVANDNFRNKIPKHKSIMIELAHQESQSCSNTKVRKTYSAFIIHNLPTWNTKVANQFRHIICHNNFTGERKWKSSTLFFSFCTLLLSFYAKDYWKAPISIFLYAVGLEKKKTIKLRTTKPRAVSFFCIYEKKKKNDRGILNLISLNVEILLVEIALRIQTTIEANKKTQGGVFQF